MGSIIMRYERYLTVVVVVVAAAAAAVVVVVVIVVVAAAIVVIVVICRKKIRSELSTIYDALQYSRWPPVMQSKGLPTFSIAK